MTQYSNDQDSHEQDLSKLYQKVSNEMPSSELDKNILWQAKQFTESRRLDSEGGDSSHVPKQKKETRFWFKWQWGGSVAASAILMSVVWLSNNPEKELALIPEGQTPAVLMVEPANLAPSFVEVASEEGVKQTTLLSDASDTQSQTRFAKVSQTLEEAKTEELGAIRLQTSDVSVEETENATQSLDELLAQVKDNRRREAKVDTQREAEFIESRPLLLKEVDPESVDKSQLYSSLNNSLTTSESDVRLGNLGIDIELEKLLRRVTQFQRALYNTEIQNAEDEKAINTQMTNAQMMLIRLINSKKQQSPDWVIDAKYLDVLTPEQRQQLLGE